jgi:hypothetical protein
LLLDLSGGIGFHPVSLAVFASLSNTCASDNLAAYQALEPLIYHGREDHLYKLSFLQTQLFPLHLTPTCVVATAAWPARFVFLLAALLEEGATTTPPASSSISKACLRHSARCCLPPGFLSLCLEVNTPFQPIPLPVFRVSTFSDFLDTRISNTSSSFVVGTLAVVFDTIIRGKTASSHPT